MTTFSSNDDIITTKIENVEKIIIDNPEDYFEIQHCIDFVRNNGYKTLALQFPDELLSYAKFVYESIRNVIITEVEEFRIYVLADTSYGSCCVDEVTASHADADSIIHFGASCLSSTENIPVLYVFGQSQVDVDDFREKMKEMFSDQDKVLLFYDATYNYCIGKISEQLPEIKAEVVVTKIMCLKSCKRDSGSGHNRSDRIDGRECANECRDCTNEDRNYINKNRNENDVKDPKDENEDRNEINKNRNENDGKDSKDAANGVCELEDAEESMFGRNFTLTHDLYQYDIVYIGGESLTLTNLILTYNKHKVYSYNPNNKRLRLETIKVNQSLMKRFYLIEKAKDSNIVGIVMGTLGVARYKEMVARLKKVLKHAGKKFYTFIIGKMNVAKLANFMEIDIFVLVACPENTLIDGKDFYKPVVTPFEMEIACLDTREWTGEYVVDFSQLLPGCSHHVDVDDGRVRNEAEYSFITGQMRSNCNIVQDEHESSSDMTVRSKDTQVIQHTAGEYLSSRSWKGLEVEGKQLKVEDVVEGRAGIAMGYENEPDK